MKDNSQLLALKSACEELAKQFQSIMSIDGELKFPDNPFNFFFIGERRFCLSQAFTIVLRHDEWLEKYGSNMAISDAVIEYDDCGRTFQYKGKRISLDYDDADWCYFDKWMEGARPTTMEEEPLVHGEIPYVPPIPRMDSSELEEIELILGDWAMIDDQQVKVFSISANDVAVGIGEDVLFHYKPEEIKPIPITEEILDSLFNEKDISVFTNKPYWYEQNAIHDISIQQDGSVNVYWLKISTVNHREIKIPVRYIHEIQHALRLIGIRKEINL